MADSATAKKEAPGNPLVHILKSNPPVGAAILLALQALPPLSILLMASADGWNGWCTVSVALMIAAVVPAAATLLRFSWANAAGQYLCWAELIQVALRIVTTGFKPV